MSEPQRTSSIMDEIARAKAEAQEQRRSNSLPTHVVDYLKAWIMSPEHVNHPYPTEAEKTKILADTGIELKRLNNWFVNNRIRYWKPRMEALQQQQPPPHPQRQGTRQLIPISDSEGSNYVNVEVSESELTGLVKQESLPSPSPNHFDASPPLLIQTCGIPPSVSPSPLSTVSEASMSASGSVSSSYDGNTSDDASDRDVSYNQGEIAQAVILLNEKRTTTPLLRKRKIHHAPPETPRTLFRRKDIGLWRDVCQGSPRPFHEDLPTFDEAALLFGYTSEQKLCSN
jgi:Homeobox KN domain